MKVFIGREAKAFAISEIDRFDFACSYLVNDGLRSACSSDRKPCPLILILPNLMIYYRGKTIAEKDRRGEVRASHRLGPVFLSSVPARSPVHRNFPNLLRLMRTFL